MDGGVKPSAGNTAAEGSHNVAASPSWAMCALCIPFGLLLLALVRIGFDKLPRGFGFGHWRLWSFEILPAALALCLLAGVALWRRRPFVLRGVFFVAGLTFLATSVLLLALFRASNPYLAAGPAVLGLATLTPVALLRRARPERPRLTWSVLAAIAVASAFVLVWSLRAPDASTLPSDAALHRPLPENLGPLVLRRDDAHTSMLPEQTRRRTARPAVTPHPLDEGDGVFRVREDGFSLDVDPHLRFQSRSEDRFWTAFAWHVQHATDAELIARRLGTHEVEAQWRTSDGLETTFVSRNAESNDVRIDARFDLAHEVFTHLSTWTNIRFERNAVASDPRENPNTRVGFSPCAETPIEVFVADYPEGRPVRFAYMTEDERFLVVEATTGEKGPFETLCEGRLRRGDPLTIEFYRDDAVVASTTLIDFSAQASTEPSPTAGWGVPQNALQLMRLSDDALAVHVTLAATGIGRGWDTVGWTPGVYQNRIDVSY